MAAGAEEQVSGGGPAPGGERDERSGGHDGSVVTATRERPSPVWAVDVESGAGDVLWTTGTPGQPG
ncbi:hypothetical protein GCM10009593_10380 [Microlunatus antarcticus]